MTLSRFHLYNYSLRQGHALFRIIPIISYTTINMSLLAEEVDHEHVLHIYEIFHATVINNTEIIIDGIKGCRVDISSMVASNTSYA